MKKNIFIIVLFILANSHDAFASEWNRARDLGVDQELSEMKKASVILPPGKHDGGALHPKTGQIPGLGLSDAGAAAKGGGAGIGGANTGPGNSGTGSLPSSENSGTPPAGGGLQGEANLDTGISSSGGTGASVDAGLNLGTGGTGDSTESVPSDSISDLTEETPTVGADVSGGGGDYLISADASAGSTEVSADLIPSDSLDNTIVGETTDVGAEIDAGGDLAGSEADIGVEADIDGSVSGSDVGSDPSDGLSVTSPTGI